MKIKKILLPITILIVALIACKKDHGDNSNSDSPNLITFEYNGKLYSNISDSVPLVNLTSPASGNPGLVIWMPNVFGGNITFPRTGCAYLIPEYQYVFINEQPGCTLVATDTAGNYQAIDSERVYFYKSGNLDLRKTDCKTVSGTDWLFGPYSYQTCRIIGIFDLELQNKSQQVIKITNGKVDVKWIF
jgi:hypothetical protein